MGLLFGRRKVTLVTDIVASTEKAVALGDLEWRELLETHDEIVRKHLDDCGGREIKTTGDGFVVRFPNRDRAERCAALIKEDVVRLGISVRTSVE